MNKATTFLILSAICVTAGSKGTFYVILIKLFWRKMLLLKITVLQVSCCLGDCVQGSFSPVHSQESYHKFHLFCGFVCSFTIWHTINMPFVLAALLWGGNHKKWGMRRWICHHLNPVKFEKTRGACQRTKNSIIFALQNNFLLQRREV